LSVEDVPVTEEPDRVRAPESDDDEEGIDDLKELQIEFLAG